VGITAFFMDSEPSGRSSSKRPLAHKCARLSGYFETLFRFEIASSVPLSHPGLWGRRPSLCGRSRIRARYYSESPLLRFVPRSGAPTRAARFWLGVVLVFRYHVAAGAVLFSMLFARYPDLGPGSDLRPTVAVPQGTN